MAGDGLASGMAARHQAMPREDLRGRTVVVALDRGAAAASAAHVALELARLHRSLPCVVRAVDVGAVPHAAPLTSLMSAADALLGDTAHASQRAAVRREVQRLLGQPVAWPVHVHAGGAADVIVREAVEREAVLIVLGLRRHGMFDRVVRDETTLNVVRRADCTVLGVAPSLRGRPGCIMVGTDFTPASNAAAQMAAMMVTSPGTLVLARVRANGEGGSPPPDGRPAGSTAAAFDALVADMALPAGVAVVRVEPAMEPGGGVAAALLALAGEHEAELIAVGSRRNQWPEHAFEESVSTALVRDGRRSVLVVPPPPHRFAHEVHTRTQEASHADDHH